MSLRLRIKYQYRNLRDIFTHLKMPAFCTSTAARLLLAGLLVMAGGLYVRQVNLVTTSGYAVEQLEQKIAASSSQTKQLETELAAAESLVSIHKRLPELGLVAAGEITRLKVTSGAVAGR